MRKSKIVGVLVFLAGITLSCQDFNEPQERLVETKEYTYEINPNTIIDELDNGQKWVFKPVPNDLEASVNVEKGWKQEDFFKLIDKYKETRLSSNLKGYHLDFLWIDYDCDAIGNGPWSISAAYHKEDKSNNSGQRERYSFTIIPEKGYFDVEYELWQPLLLRWGTLDQQELKIPFEEAVQIANENGGQEYIDKYNGNCAVDINLISRRGNKQFWKVRYLGPEWYVTNDFVEVFVNTVTGKAHKNNFIDYLFDL